MKRDNLAFPILSDSDGRVIRAFGVLHEHGGPGGIDIAVPAQFLVRRDGTIAWSHVSTRIQSRSDPADTLAAVAELAQ